MNKNKIALGVLCAAIVVGLIYNQDESENDNQQGVNSKILGEGGKSTLTNTLESSTNKDSITESVLLSNTDSAVVQVGNSTSPATSAMISENKSSVQVHEHEQPTDHLSEQQPKAHGHENQRRNREDNSLMPPGEPKKPQQNEDSNG
jgi:hypothetical protein